MTRESSIVGDSGIKLITATTQPLDSAYSREITLNPSDTPHHTMSEQAQPVPTDAQAAGVPTPANSATTAETAEPSAAGPTKGELKRRAKEAEKAKRAAEVAAKQEEEKRKREAAASVDNASQNYGKLPLHQSQERNGELDGGFELMKGRKFLKFSQLSKEDVGTPVIFRARLHNMRPQGELHLLAKGWSLPQGRRLSF